MRSNDSQKIIVVGIPKNLDDTGLSELFADFGTVAEAKVVLDTTTNASRGFGFVTFAAGSAMRAAIKCMNQKKVDGRTLNVRQLVPKDQFQSQKSEEQDASKRPCWLLRKGKCTKGANCPFSHETKDGDFGSCFEFAQTGSCKRGDACKFFHPKPQDAGEGDEVDRAVAPAPAKTPVKKDAEKHDKSKPRVCYSFQNGRCHRGKKCMFVHELLPSETNEPAALPKDKKKTLAGKKTPVKATEEAFEVITQVEAGKKRRREDADEDEGDDMAGLVNMGKPQAMKPKKAPAAAGLAAHVNGFLGKQAKTVVPKKFEWKAKTPATSGSKHQQSYQQERPAKKVKTEKVDMGAAFDGVSDDEGAKPRGKKRVVDKEKLRATREKAKQERRAKRGTKKSALARLKEATEITLGSA